MGAVVLIDEMGPFGDMTAVVPSKSVVHAHVFAAGGGTGAANGTTTPNTNAILTSDASGNTTASTGPGATSSVGAAATFPVLKSPPTPPPPPPPPPAPARPAAPPPPPTAAAVPTAPKPAPFNGAADSQQVRDTGGIDPELLTGDLFAAICQHTPENLTDHFCTGEPWYRRERRIESFKNATNERTAPKLPMHRLAWFMSVAYPVRNFSVLTTYSSPPPHSH